MMKDKKIISITMMYVNLQQTLVVFPIFTYKSKPFFPFKPYYFIL
jgi:hypothetical protein